MFNPKLLLVPSNVDVVLWQKGTIQTVFESGKRGNQVMVCESYLPHSNLGVLVSCEDGGVVE